jgi:hypothetical protein
MKRKLFCLITIVTILTAGCLFECGGCGCKSEHEVVNVTHDSDYQEPDFSNLLPTEEELGVAVYTGDIDPSSVSSSKKETDGEVTHVGVDYSTSDDLDTVLNWYKSQLGEPTNSQELNGYQSYWWTMVKDGKEIEVIVGGQAEGTAISILSDKQ